MDKPHTADELAKGDLSVADPAFECGYIAVESFSKAFMFPSGHVHTKIDAIASEKTTLAGTDLFLIEDSADSNNKKKVQIANLPDDATAIHTDETGEINGLSDKASPDGADVIVVEDSAASYAKKKVSISNLPSTDADAIHDNVSGEINAITAKDQPIGADLLLIEDSAATNSKKKITMSTLPLAETKSPKGEWKTTSTIDFTAKSGQPSTIRKTFQDGKQRSWNLSSAATWNISNGVADLRYDEAASQGRRDYRHRCP